MRHADSRRWRVEAPPNRVIDAGDLAGLGPWFAEVWALRGGVFHDGGRRPGFDLSGKRLDPDPLDLYAHHVLTHGPGGLVGCVRVLPRCSPPVGLTETLLGRARCERVLEDIGASRPSTVEAGRWVVHADLRAQGLGARLAAAAWALSRHLGSRTLLAPAGTADGQDRLLAKIGLRPAPGIEPFRSGLFADEVRVMYALLDEPDESFGRIIDHMTSVLDLGRGA